MRVRVLSVAAVVFAAFQAGSLYAQDPVARGSVLSGTIQAPICSSDNFASGDASGELSGQFFVAFDCKDGTIAGGTWLVLVTTTLPDGTVEVRGTIRGQVLRGSFEADADGNQLIVRDVALEIVEGTGEYAAVMAGTGSLEAVADADITPQFTGTLALTF